MVAVRLDAMRRESVSRRERTSGSGSVAHLLDDLEREVPRLRFRRRDATGAIRPFVQVFLNGAEVGRGAESALRLGPSDSIDILHSIQGG